MKRRVWITGGHGFLGSAVLRRFTKDKSIEILAPTRKQLDVGDEAEVEAFWRKMKPTSLVHLAAFARGLGGNIHAGSDAFLWNESLVRAPLLAGLRHGVDEVFFAGTVAEYGYPYRTQPLDETDVTLGRPHGGEVYYAYAKRLASLYLDVLSERWETRVSHGLLTNMYGPNDRYDLEHGHVVAAMLLKFATARQLKLDEVVLWGMPTTTRDFLHVDDAAGHIYNLLGENTGRVNVASGTSMEMGEVAQIISSALEFEGRIVWDSSRPVGIPHRSLSVSLLSRFSAQESRPLSVGIQDTINAEKFLLG